VALGLNGGIRGMDYGHGVMNLPLCFLLSYFLCLMIYFPYETYGCDLLVGLVPVKM
jgi:hypothetical protein